MNVPGCWTACAVWLCVVPVGSPAWAQPAAGQLATRRAGQELATPLDVRGILSWERIRPFAPESVQTVTGQSALFGGGAGLEVGRGPFFARVAVTRIRFEGERVIVMDSETIRLGIPLEVTMWPVELGVGWRFRLSDRLPLRPYAGAALALMAYRETSEGADPEENVRRVHAGFAAFGGLDVRLNRWVSAGAEIQARSFPGALGRAGASAAFGETNLGGALVRMFFTVGRQR